jgi:hypothetical protein
MSLVPMMVVWHEDDCRDLAAWLERKTDLPYAAQSLLIALRYSVGRSLYDQMRPVMDALQKDDAA